MSITTRKNRKTGEIVGYQVAIRIAGSEPSFKTYKTYDDALDAEQVNAAAIRVSRAKAPNRQGLVRPARPGHAAFFSQTLASILDDFKKTYPDHSFSRHVKPAVERVGEARVMDLDDDWMKQWCAKLRKLPNRRGGTLKEQTLAHYIRILKHVCKWRAKALGLQQPDLGLTFRHLDRDWNDGRERRLRNDEEARVYAQLGQIGCRAARGKNVEPGSKTKPRACARHYQLFYVFSLETAARRAELVDMPWDEIDLEEGFWHLGARRTKMKYKRTIILTPRAMEALRELDRDRRATSPRVFHRLPKAKAVGRTFHDVVASLEIEDLRLHDMRHDGATRHWLSGAFDLGSLLKMVGHKNLKTAMTYLNPTPEELRARMWGKLGVPLPQRARPKVENVSNDPCFPVQR